jgi:anaerobic magnesium-protoporphyrin IX monomethyl ester cyclase
MAFEGSEHVTDILSRNQSSRPSAGAIPVTLICPGPDPEYIFAYGVRILSACLKRVSCPVKILFLPRDTGEVYPEQVLEQIAHLSEGSALIGISLMTDDFENSIRITRRLKLRLSAPVIWGGIHPTLQPKQCLEYADMVCIGEGEETLIELVQKMARGEDYHHVPGTWQKHNGELIANPLRPLVNDLDSVPYPDYDHRDHAILINGQVVPLTYDILVERMPEPAPPPWRSSSSSSYLALTTRGCPFRCNYCFNHAFRRLFPDGPVVRKRSIANVIGELKLAQERFPSLTHIWIDDDSFFVRKDKEIEDFSREYKANIRIPLWVTGANPSTVTARKLAALADAGMDAIHMGIQTASPRISKLYARRESNQQATAAVQLFRKFSDQIKTLQFSILLDNPWETESDLRATLLFLSKLPVPCDIFLFPLVLYPGTDLHEKAGKENVINRNRIGEELFRNRAASKTYFNAIFFLLSDCAHRGQTIPFPLMYLLTHPLLIRLRISQILYRGLKAWRERRVIGSFRQIIARTLCAAFKASPI